MANTELKKSRRERDITPSRTAVEIFQMHPCHRMSKAVVLMLCSAAPSLALVHTPVLRTAAVRNVQVPHAMRPSLINTQPHTASIARTSTCSVRPLCQSFRSPLGVSCRRACAARRAQWGADRHSRNLRSLVWEIARSATNVDESRWRLLLVVLKEAAGSIQR